MTAPSFWQPLPWYLVTPPDRRHDVIDRPRLSGLIDESLARHRLVLACAPSGYGKTVAARQWVQIAEGSVAWLSLDREDWSAIDLIRGIVTALGRGADGRAGLPDLIDVRSGVTDIVRLVEATAGPTTVVIDDAHRAASAFADPSLASLLEIGPPRLRFLLIGHGALALELNRLLVHGAAVEIDSARLAFDATEIHSVAQYLGVEVAADDAAELQRATGGWPIAVRAALAGADGSMTDYVADSILARLPEDLAEFVLAATVDERVDGTLAVALTGRADAATLLEQCLSRSLFLNRFDNPADASSEPVYQWHQLFAQRCHTILATRDRERARTLDRIAAEHLGSYRPLDAVRHALRGGHVDLAWQTFGSRWLDLVITSRDDEVEQICTTLASNLTLDAGQLVVIDLIRACCREVGGDRAGAAELLSEASRRYLGLPESAHTWDAAVARYMAVMLCSDDPAALDAAVDDVWAVLTESTGEPHGAALRACAAFVTGWTKVRLRSDPVRAAQLLESAVRQCNAVGLTDIARWAMANQAFALAYAGKLGAAEALLEQWRAPAGDRLWTRSYDSGIERFTTGLIAFWRGDLAAAQEIEVQLSPMDSVRGGYQPLARVHRVYTACTLGDLAAIAAAEASLALIPDENPHGVPWTAYKRMCLVRIAEVRGQYDDVRRLGQDFGTAVNVPVLTVMMAAVWRRLSEPDRALDQLAGFDPERAPSYVVVHALLTRAVVASMRDDRTAARQLLDRSLAIAVPERIMLPYLENRDEATTALLTDGAHAGPHREFVGECLARRAEISLGSKAAAERLRLTPRERELLGLLRSNLELSEIAANLGISLNTLNTHRRSLYRKIGARNRREAVRYADFLMGAG
ncbi:LuxR C-terminal-related transcriptional regulator [Mycolicibacterium sp. 050232]|uniref:helix-turn-helix transcriptional regulator n=1 Tax=Mycolicibacterium sp. 050232 TaxID=3113982 RepID=UPI002E290AB5|nr:LuxR C-terminal-related transcriptional regulator [Mycolicibacterium sp. 050232]MED5811058.1 LuxR C-terminal-related transcriptional regulator [Mycolicibacterium sp. 050232]